MVHVTIKRCPFCPSIRSQVEGIVKALEDDLRVPTSVEDGAKGELSVFAGGVPVIRRTGDGLPSVDEVEMAVRNAMPAGG